MPEGVGKAENPELRSPQPGDRGLDRGGPSPSRGQSHGLVGAVWRRKVQALQAGSPPLFIACCGQGYPVSDQRVLRPALAQKAAAPELLEDLLPARAVQVGGTTCRMGGSSGGEGKACCQATDGWRGGGMVCRALTQAVHLAMLWGGVRNVSAGAGQLGSTNLANSDSAFSWLRDLRQVS